MKQCLLSGPQEAEGVQSLVGSGTQNQAFKYYINFSNIDIHKSCTGRIGEDFTPEGMFESM